MRRLEALRRVRRLRLKLLGLRGAPAIGVWVLAFGRPSRLRLLEPGVIAVHGNSFDWFGAAGPQKGPHRGTDQRFGQTDAAPTLLDWD
jgi:hypothetical protein